MKTTFLSGISALMLLSCGPKTTAPVTVYTPGATGPAQTAVVDGCTDTMAEYTFVNGRTVELRLNILDKTSVREGNTIVNTWKNIKIVPIPAGDSTTVSLRSGKQFMYNVLGPVSVNVAGLGVIAEEKFTLNPCEKRRKVL